MIRGLYLSRGLSSCESLLVFRSKIVEFVAFVLKLGHALVHLVDLLSELLYSTAHDISDFLAGSKLFNHINHDFSAILSLFDH